MTIMIRAALAAPFVLSLAACGEPAAETRPAAQPAAPDVFTVLVQGTPVGAAEVSAAPGGYEIAYEYRNNGRGPTLNETIVLDDAGLPASWTIDGATTFGNAVAERFVMEDGQARWTDSTGDGEARPAEPSIYVPQNASPYALAITARALLADPDRSMPALPGGTLRLDELETFEVRSSAGEAAPATAWALSGTSYNPSYFFMIGEDFLGFASPSFAVVAEDFTGEEAHLRERAQGYAVSRYEEIQSRVAHEWDAPVRVRDVRLFDPDAEALTEPVSVLVENGLIQAVEAPGAGDPASEVIIDGAGGVLVPGLFEMHAHLGSQAAFLNIAAGVTAVRDMGNDNAVLADLIEDIDTGLIAGPEVFRSAFIEGRSPFNSNSGIVVESEADAVAAVDAYADMGGFHQIKIYNSINPDWVPAMIERARERGLRVTGHVPAFTNANAMIEAGYDEMTHINQVMLGWVLEDGEDTRTLLRLTALQRLPALSLDGEAVARTLGLMVENGVAIDPTFAIHEALLLSRNGEVSPGSADVIDHLPVDAQRRARSAWAAISTPEEDAAYRGAYDQLVETLRMMRERGVFMVPGTDLGGGFALHRELELYQQIGMSPAEILAWAGQGMADYLGAGDRLGSISPGKEADFFLIAGDPTQDLKAIKAISMTAADGRFYFPSEIYPEFGIRPFADAPAVSEPG